MVSFSFCNFLLKMSPFYFFLIPKKNCVVSQSLQHLNICHKPCHICHNFSTIPLHLTPLLRLKKLDLWICTLHRLQALYFFFSELDFIFRAVLGTHQNWVEDTEISHILLGPIHVQPPPLSTSTTEWYICDNWWTCIDMSLSPKVHSSHWGLLLFFYILCTYAPL